MGEWSIYGVSSGQVKAAVKKLEYNGEFMGERSLTCTLYSPTPIDLSVGDYLTYRNEVFAIDYDPSILKQARNNTYGQGYVYDSVKFNSRQMELVYCKFLDYVIADNQVHYSSLPNFSFYCETITNLTERIQANLNRLYTGGKAWTITVNTQNVHVGRINIDVQGMTCWDALGLIASKFESTFVIRGRNIVVAPSTDILTGLFQYGKGNGLRSIARTSDPSQGVVTRLRAMGNTTNMPYNYYRNKDMYVYAPITEVLGPYETSADIHTTYDFNNCFTVKAGTSADNQYRTKVSLDKTNWAPAIFSANAAWVGYSVASVMQLPGYDPVQYAAFMQQLNTGTYTKLYFESGISKDKWPSQYKEYTGTLGVTTGEDRLMLPAYPDVTTDPYIDSANISKYGIREESVIFDGSNGLDDIFPTIQGMTAEQARAAGATISLDSGDNGHLDEIVSATQIDDDGIPPVEGEESNMVETFSITLKDIGFNINDYFATDNAVISMRDGKCEGREFEITECVKSGNKYVLTCKRELDDSLNRYFPYDDYNLTAGDKFVLLQIEMPELYIDAAAQRLEDAAEAYLATIDHSIYTIEPKIDNIKAKRHDDEVDSSGEGVKVYDTIYEGMLMQIEDEDLDIDDAIFIDRLTIKEGESLIPQYEVVLRNEKVKTSIQQIQQQITDIKSGVAGVSGGGTVDANQVNQLIKNYGDNRFLRKDIIDKLKSGVQVGDRFVSGLLGEGGIFRKEQDGTTYLEADKMYIRLKAYFDTVEIRKFLHSAGNRIASVAGGKCIRVEPLGIYQGNKVVTDENGVYHYKDGSGQDRTAQLSIVSYKCYFRGSDGDDEVRNNFVVGDLAYCHITSVAGQSDSPESKGFNQKHYWRLVVGRNVEGSLTDDGEYWIELSNKSSETITIDGDTYSHAGLQVDSDVPEAQDDIVQLGNIADVTRQGAIIEYVTGADAPSYQIYQGIDDFSLSGKNYIAIGYNTQTGRAYMNVYGDFFFGDKAATPTTYVKYNSSTKKLEIKAVISAQSPVSLDNNTEVNWQTFIRQNQNNWTPAQIESIIFDSEQFTSMEDAIEELQNQADGAIETWYFDADPPTLSNDPAVDWTTDDLKDQHIGDLYYSGQGNAYRFIYNDQTGTYSWVQLSDDAIAEALRIAREAQDTADGKRKIFVRQPAYADSYDIGDLWVNAYYNSGGVTYSNDILVAISPKAANVSFDIDDWTLSSKYTDDTYARNWINNVYSPFAESIQTQVDGKAETWRQASDPSSSWSTNDEKKKHVGDLWLDTSANGGNKTYIYQNTGTASNPNYQWVQQAVPTEVFNKIDGKSCIYMNAVSSPPTNYKRGDLWILQENATINGVAYKDGDVLTASTSSETYSAAHWSKEMRYTGDEKIDGFINQILNGSGASGNDATVANMLRAIGSAYNNGETYTAGGLVLTNLINLGTGSISAGTFVPWAGISGEYDSRTQAQGGAKGNGIAAWYGGLNLDKEDGATQNTAKSLFRFDGSGYLADGNITWNAQGAVTIRNITTLYDSQDSNILNELTRFNNAFTFATSGQESTTVLSITPNAPFTRLKILENGNGNDVATQVWVTSQFVTKSFFSRLFQAFNGGTPVNPNDLTTTIDNIQSMFRFWTEFDISALGNGGSGGGGGGASVLNELDDVTISESTLANGQVLTYQNGVWVNAEGGGGGLDPTAMWNALSASTNEQINASHLSTALSSYVTSTAMTNALANYLPLTGGTLSGGLSTRTITPASNSSYSLGTEGSRWRSIYTTDVYSTYFSFHSGGYLQEESSELMWHEGNGSYTVIHSGNYSDYITDTDTTYKLTLNGTTNGTSSGTSLGSFYAPTSAGTNGYVLKSNGSGAPSWVAQSTLSVGSATKATQDGDGNTITTGYVRIITTSSSYLDNSTGSAVIGFNQNGNPIDGTTTQKYGAVIQWSNTNAVAPATSAQNNWYFQLIGTTTTDLYWRRRYNGGSWSTAKMLLDSGNGVTLNTTQTISGLKTFNNTVKLQGAGIEDVGGAGLLAYHLAWVGTDTSRWTVGTIDSQGVIRSGNQDLEHYRYTGDTSTSYRWSIIDTYNILSNLVYDSNFSNNAPCAKLVTIKITSTYRNEGINFSIVGRGSSTPCHVSIKFSNSSSSDPSLATFCYEGNPTYGVLLHLYKTATSTWEVWTSNQQTYDRTYVYNVTARQGITITPHRSAYASALPSSPLASYSCSPTVAYSTYINFRNTADSDNAGYCGRGSTANNDIALMAYSGDLLLGSHNTVRMRFTSSAIFTLASMNFGIGISNPTQKLHVDGNILATGDVTALSDIRHKSPISDVNTRIEDVANLPIFYFKWKAGHDDNMHIGTSAQAVQKLFPELVLGGEELSVNYGVLGTTLGILNSRKLTEHEKRILDLEKENKRLRERIMILEDRA